MFNVYAFEKKVREDDSVREQEEKNKRVMSTHRKMRDLLAENYQKRVAMFIREMADTPVAHNDDYSMRLTLNTSNISENAKNHFTSLTSQKFKYGQPKLTPKSWYTHNFSKSLSTSHQEPHRDFRYASFRTEKERIEATIRANQQFWDSVPMPSKNKFEKSLRPRDESLEVGPQFRFTAKTGVERVYDQLSKRIASAFQTKELIGTKLKGTFRDSKRANQTTSPKQLLPCLHNKTHFKAATSIFLKSQLEKSLRDKTHYLSRALRDISSKYTEKTWDDKSPHGDISIKVLKPSSSNTKNDK
jgi:hypothetical protein